MYVRLSCGVDLFLLDFDDYLLRMQFTQWQLNVFLVDRSAVNFLVIFVCVVDFAV